MKNSNSTWKCTELLTISGAKSIAFEVDKVYEVFSEKQSHSLTSAH